MECSSLRAPHRLRSPGYDGVSLLLKDFKQQSLSRRETWGPSLLQKQQLSGTQRGACRDRSHAAAPQRATGCVLRQSPCLLSHTQPTHQHPPCPSREGACTHSVGKAVVARPPASPLEVALSRCAPPAPSSLPSPCCLVPSRSQLSRGQCTPRSGHIASSSACV